MAGRLLSWTMTGLAGLACVMLAGCSSTDTLTKKASGKDPKYGVAASPRLIGHGQPIAPDLQYRGVSMVGKPYQVAGKTYVPKDDPGYKATGIASWYGDDFHGRLTANGEVYDMYDISAAHPTMPLPSYARVTNLENGYSLVVRVNDRGPYHRGRVIDVSGRAADLLDLRHSGTAKVKVEYVGRARTRGSDEEILEATLRTDGRRAPSPDYSGGVMLAEFTPETVPMPVMRSAFVPVDAVAPASPLLDIPTEPAIDLGTIPNADMPVPRPDLERSAALSQPEVLSIDDVVRGAGHSSAMAFASLSAAAVERPVFVTAGGFGDRAAAEHLAARLSVSGDVAVMRTSDGGGDVWAVRAGPYAKAASVDLARSLANEAGAKTVALTD
jgi:rare lipoprotein A